MTKDKESKGLRSGEQLYKEVKPKNENTLKTNEKNTAFQSTLIKLISFCSFENVTWQYTKYKSVQLISF